ncbi:bifunctional alpha,alpha-trehalose-phosphate synthase (UDP-forming)/trehalose-phosphatase [Ancylomarina sp. 16SWW S1-10-2]|uniref:bifunctional alpha,alpha-trehalose-phosphate synthase (UDP-forming)/trehalose-phosphatase n=1 Tax=Ancylomarina sp. 16SWW S1-10-2 TaxID=2499681 RepID=UPI0012AE5542|nr:bifunctional alpha,alpha-trehalose-phosphate synthase (UDP-forming)/trehalose-phosphatase [Ancylomarina sp. 16SWW S1-10-2]MRT92723.1 bifunctional alpha,alpha-trehalose-phosphate synthase (UDP-forming)/trehalose-phosphatase [Ancylomarina sp. 16SWW S1-10-2]
MNRIHIVSNRLPFSINVDNEKIDLIPSVGGLATGMRSVYKEYNGKWIGWPGLPSDDIDENLSNKIDTELEKEDCVPVHLTKEEVDLYYDGFSNRTIWPLFHYFAQYIDYDPKLWESFVSVNQKFADKAIETLEEGDTIWIHDYQLLLVPEMIKSKRPGVTVGFFLHIPFPSFEVFRILPWRKELIQGMLGADLIGFHTYDYQRHFFSSVRRLMGYEISFNQIQIEDRIIIVDAFPMGIDYDKFKNAAIDIVQKPLQEKSELHRELEKYFLLSPDRKLVLSIDRLDYSKGIPNRLKAFAEFLEKYPEFVGKVTLIMLAVPSRGTVEHYINLKSEVDELVGKVNGQFGNINYTPVWYFYRSMPFESLIELYSSCDVCLVTPVRDGMNLVAKEYVASRTNHTGVIILSEMAGVVKEMGEALIINPNNTNEIADSIQQALTMSLEEQRERMVFLQDRIKRYDVFKWASEFVDSLGKVQKIQHSLHAKRVNTHIMEKIQSSYKNSKMRAIFLDYDGTLTGFKKKPNDACPDKELHELLYKLEADPKNIITIISGRDRESLENWFEGHKINFIVEHGVWSKKFGKEWKMLTNATDTWKSSIQPILESFVDRTPGTFIEEKNYSLVWHFRKAEPEQAELRANELKDELRTMIANHNLEILEGNKVIEVKTGGINKGIAALQFIKNKSFDFILAMGDDWTDEYMFRELPETAYTIKVGLTHTAANYKVESVSGVRTFLAKLEE